MVQLREKLNDKDSIEKYKIFKIQYIKKI